MLITLVDERTIRLSFPYHAPTVEAIKKMPGYQFEPGERPTWAVPLCNLRRIVDMWPGARLEDGVIDARLELWRVWIRQFNALGVWFAYDVDGATVIAMGQGVSPALQDWVAKHSGLLWRFLGEQVFPTPIHEEQPVTPVQISEADRLVWSGIQNARQAEDQRRAVYQKPKRKPTKYEQMELYR